MGMGLGLGLGVISLYTWMPSPKPNPSIHLDALPRRERQVARRAVALAPSARDAAVDERAGQAVVPDVLGVDVRVLVEDDPRVEQELGVEEALHL